MSENSVFRAPEGAGDVPVAGDGTARGSAAPEPPAGGSDADVFDGPAEAEVSRRVTGRRSHGLDTLMGW
ncbi:hypothetical protein [Streptomyces peucetius]|uniref:Uncharacterized protein n=1 Tax=Streptomyces peucetius TaxID=1950 RepID=A0ABY6I130_STRPE|nr:hypothetical protein [Streptomyces peucetius]UYQ60474.1 hypothetical protein OGH68_02610 [Streptomyces peucetius]